VPSRAAASSIASGSPSSLRQIRSATATGATPPPIPPRADDPRSKNNRTAGACAAACASGCSGGRSSGRTGHTTSPGRPSGSRLVASTRSPGAARSSAPASCAHASSRCSQLSSTSSSSADRSRQISASSTGTSPACRTPSAPITCAPTSPGSATPASSASHTPPGNLPTTRAPASSASRVLPVPPVPASVTPRLARWLLGLGIAATLTANMAQGWSHGPVGAVIAAWPAVSLVGSYELLVWLIRTSGTVERGPSAEPACAGEACRTVVRAAPAAAVDGERSGRSGRNASGQMREMGGHVGQPTSNASAQQRGEGPEAGAVNDAAVAAYRLSVQAGNPLSERKLAQVFGRTSRRWARARIAEARQASPLPDSSGTPVTAHP
jgi:hypothetical protein